MEKGKVSIFYGHGKGKTSSALGYGIRCASMEKPVIIIQFMREKNEDEISFIRRLEPEIKFFRFEKSQGNYEGLSEDEKKEERENIRNGFNFARKAMGTRECSVLILDEFLGLLDYQVVSLEEFRALLASKPEDMELIFTGRTMDERLRPYADEIYCIREEKG